MSLVYLCSHIVCLRTKQHCGRAAWLRRRARSMPRCLVVPRCHLHFKNKRERGVLVAFHTPFLKPCIVTSLDQIQFRLSLFDLKQVNQAVSPSLILSSRVTFRLEATHTVRIHCPYLRSWSVPSFIFSFPSNKNTTNDLSACIRSIQSPSHG